VRQEVLNNLKQHALGGVAHAFRKPFVDQGRHVERNAAAIEAA
jgi:hypothetical protein